jgi:DNA polymerase-1
VIVTRKNFLSVIRKLKKPGQYGLDTETTGLRQTDRLFSIIFSDDDGGYYFNFNSSIDHEGGIAPYDQTLPLEWLEKLSPILENKGSLFFLSNAKFDLGMLAKEGLSVMALIHDTEVIERVLKNNRMKYGLASIAPNYGFKKDESVDEYITKHKLYTEVSIPGKDKRVKNKHFDRVPLGIIAPYGIVDAVIVRAIGMAQRETLKFHDMAAPSYQPPQIPLVKNEYKLTKACFRIEKAGIHIDRVYTQKALNYCLKEQRAKEKLFEKETGVEFEDSASTIAEVFSKNGVELPKTKTGKPCTAKGVLDALENPIADRIREIRGLQKLASTYYSSFLYHADKEDLIHANMRQGGTETLRFSYSDPNLQNLPKEDDEDDRLKPYIVRRCFTPLDSDWCFVPIDFKQQEYRVMADYAGETELIKAIMNGEDVHEATARMLGISRQYAKTLNFGLLYGMGAGKLAYALKISLSDAHKLKNAYFERLPMVKRFVRRVMDQGIEKGYVFNWNGFKSHISSSEFAYILPNHIVQGSCAQVIRVAMVEIDDALRKYKLRSRVVLQVHDELLFQMHHTEFDKIPLFKKIMENVYRPRNGMILECSVDHSWKSFAKFDMKKGIPDVKEARNLIQGKNTPAIRSPA